MRRPKTSIEAIRTVLVAADLRIPEDEIQELVASYLSVTAAITRVRTAEPLADEIAITFHAATIT